MQTIVLYFYSYQHTVVKCLKFVPNRPLSSLLFQLSKEMFSNRWRVLFARSTMHVSIIHTISRLRKGHRISIRPNANVWSMSNAWRILNRGDVNNCSAFSFVWYVRTTYTSISHFDSEKIVYITFDYLTRARCVWNNNFSHM